MHGRCTHFLTFTYFRHICSQGPIKCKVGPMPVDKKTPTDKFGFVISDICTSSSTQRTASRSKYSLCAYSKDECLEWIEAVRNVLESARARSASRAKALTFPISSTPISSTPQKLSSPAPLHPSHGKPPRTPQTLPSPVPLHPPTPGKPPRTPSPLPLHPTHGTPSRTTNSRPAHGTPSQKHHRNVSSIGFEMFLPRFNIIILTECTAPAGRPRCTISKFPLWMTRSLASNSARRPLRFV